MKRLRASRLDKIVTIAFEDKDGNTCQIVLCYAPLLKKWYCPVMAYTKTTKAGYTSVFGLKNGWKPNAKMIKAAEKVLS